MGWVIYSHTHELVDIVVWLCFSCFIVLNFELLAQLDYSYLLPVGFLITSVDIASFQSNIIPFGADQIVNKTLEEELGSYFCCYYWVRISFTCESYHPNCTCIHSHCNICSKHYCRCIVAKCNILPLLNYIWHGWLLPEYSR